MRRARRRRLTPPSQSTMNKGSCHASTSPETRWPPSENTARATPSLTRPTLAATNRGCSCSRCALRGRCGRAGAPLKGEGMRPPHTPTRVGTGKDGGAGRGWEPRPGHRIDQR